MRASKKILRAAAALRVVLDDLEAGAVRIHPFERDLENLICQIETMADQFKEYYEGGTNYETIVSA